MVHDGTEEIYVQVAADLVEGLGRGDLLEIEPGEFTPCGALTKAIVQTQTDTPP